ncbi:MAG: hypothetical protein ABIQ03_10410 [Burkholderiales bacterium]
MFDRAAQFTQQRQMFVAMYLKVRIVDCKAGLIEFGGMHGNIGAPQ